MNLEGSDGSDANGEAVGAAMRLARCRLGLSQRALADALGWDRARVGRWESGRVPEGFEQVVGLLRVLGFGLALTDLVGPRAADRDEPAERLRDRGGRRFPAHLDLCQESTSTTWNWTRHRCEPSPGAGGMSFRRRTPAQARDEGRRSIEGQAARSGMGTGDDVPPPDPEPEAS